MQCFSNILTNIIRIGIIITWVAQRGQSGKKEGPGWKNRGEKDVFELVIYPAENVEAGNKFSRRGGAAASVRGRTLTRGGNSGGHDILTRAARKINEHGFPPRPARAGRQGKIRRRAAAQRRKNKKEFPGRASGAEEERGYLQCEKNLAYSESPHGVCSE